MDKRNLLDRVAADGEERLLYARILDKWEQCERRSIPTHTDFLSPAAQRGAEELLHTAGVTTGYGFFGGYDRAERKILSFCPPWQDEPDPAEELAFLRCTFYETGALTHRDFLGSLMGMGIVREKLGDLLILPNSADVIVRREVADFLLREWTAAGRIRLRVAEIAPEELNVPVQNVREIRDTVATLRLDAVAACGFSTSRTRAAELIAAGRVQKNYRDCLKADAPVAEGDVISARGLGKCELTTVGGQSKKGRTMIVIHRFL